MVDKFALHDAWNEIIRVCTPFRGKRHDRYCDNLDFLLEVMGRERLSEIYEPRYRLCIYDPDVLQKKGFKAEQRRRNDYLVEVKRCTYQSGS